MNIPKATLSRLLLVVCNSNVTEIEKQIVGLMVGDDAEAVIKLLQEQIRLRETAIQQAKV